MTAGRDRSSVWAGCLPCPTFLGAWGENVTVVHALQTWERHGSAEGGAGAGGVEGHLPVLSLPPQLRQRFELEIERMEQMHQKDREDREEELEDVRQSCQKRVRKPRWAPAWFPLPYGEVGCGAWGQTLSAIT